MNQKQQERLARRIEYATGQQVNVTSATPVTDELGDVAGVKVTGEKLPEGK